MINIFRILIYMNINTLLVLVDVGKGGDGCCEGGHHQPQLHHLEHPLVVQVDEVGGLVGRCDAWWPHLVDQEDAGEAEAGDGGQHQHQPPTHQDVPATGNIRSSLY